tara:strand:- start:542 stop:1135 length:594 start_codon:yes stop_codon:yes gene_type:complete
MKRLLVFVFIGILFQGCVSIHNGVIAPNSVNVSTDNFQIIKTIGGKATAGYFLGFGGGGKNGLVKEAKRDMYKSHPPLPNEMITNITVDDKKFFLFGGIYIEHTVFVTADVVRFGEYNLEQVEKEKTKRTNSNLTKGAVVYWNDIFQNKMVKGNVYLLNGNNVYVTYIDLKGKTKKKQLSINEVYIKSDGKYIKYKK